MLHGLLRSLYSTYPVFDAAAEASGPTERPIGQMLSDAKLFVGVYAAAASDIYSDHTFKTYYELYNVFGDPSMMLQRLP